MTVPDCGGPEKREAEAIVIDNLLQLASFRTWEISFKSEVSQSSQYPRAAMTSIGEVDDARSIDELSTSASTTGDPFTDFENHNFGLRKILKKLQETSHHSQRKSAIRAEITHKQADCL